jgi:hypothetical protein
VVFSDSHVETMTLAEARGLIERQTGRSLEEMTGPEPTANGGNR